MLSHVTVGSNDLERARCFYDAVLAPLGILQRTVAPDGGPRALCWISRRSSVPRFYVYSPLDGRPAKAGNGSMIAFLAPSSDAVKAAWSAGMAHGGSDEGAPGERSRYGAGYFGAYLRDPDGNKIHVVYRGDLQRHEDSSQIPEPFR
ncbi:VOC family protein [Prosthecomicrobium sp. N25]|uniref:VOC family protein n=1 Tax=Prosthecomicrobium sp. N25 TaxID=3129254 RepID=UPI0030770041